MGKLLMCFCLWMPVSCFAQQLQGEIDSLLSLLHRTGNTDTTKVNLLNEIAFAYYAIAPQKGLDYAEQALALSERIHFTAGKAQAFSRKSTNYWALGEDSLAMDAINKALLLHRQSGNLLNYAKTLNNRALNYYNLGNYIAAIHDHEEALTIFQKLGFISGVQHSWSNLGTVFLALDDYPRALEAFLRAKRADDKNEPLTANAAVNIGLVYKNLKNYPLSLRYHEESLALYRKLGNRQGEANALGNLAAVYDLTGQPGKAIDYYSQALAINESIGNGRRIAADLTNIGAVYNGAGQPEKAAGYLRRAVDLYQTTQDKNGLSEALLALSQTYRAADPKKLLLQKEALRTAEESGSPQRQSEALQALSGTYEYAGNDVQALQAFKRHIALRDSTFNTDKEKEITRQQMEFDFEKREALAQAEIRRQATIKNAAILGGSGLLLAGLAGFGLYKRKRDALNKQREAELNATIYETELKALRIQLNPHFIFNSLNAIGDYIVKNDRELAQEYLAEFASLMRMVLENSELQRIPLSDDLRFIGLYLEVESKRLPGRFSYSVSVEDGLDVENILVPPLLLQPFIENSIWHGLKGKQERGSIQIGIRSQAGMLVCSVEDDGPGGYSSSGNAAKRKSFGIAITESRLKIINRQKKSVGRLSITDNGRLGGTRIEVSFPLEMAF